MAFQHVFLPREKVLERLKIGERLVHRITRNEDRIVLSRTTLFENDRIGVKPSIRARSNTCRPTA